MEEGRGAERAEGPAEKKEEAVLAKQEHQLPSERRGTPAGTRLHTHRKIFQGHPVTGTSERDRLMEEGRRTPKASEGATKEVAKNMQENRLPRNTLRPLDR